MSFLRNLPVELLLIIIDRIQRRDLTTLRAVSRTFWTLIPQTRVFNTLFFRKKFMQRSREDLQRVLASPVIRRSVKELAFDMELLRKDVEPYHWEVVPQIKKISTFIAAYGDIVLERIRIVEGYYDDMAMCFTQVQGAGITSIQKLWLRPSAPLEPENAEALPKSCSIIMSPNLEIGHVVNSSNDPTEELDLFYLQLYKYSSLRSLHVIHFTIDYDDFLFILKEYEWMQTFKKIVLIDTTLYHGGLRDYLPNRNDQSLKGVTDQSQLWLDFARRFDSTFHGSRLRLLIGDTKGSVCRGSQVDYSRFQRSVRTLGEDEVVDKMSTVDFEG